MSVSRFEPPENAKGSEQKSLPNPAAEDIANGARAAGVSPEEFRAELRAFLEEPPSPRPNGCLPHERLLSIALERSAVISPSDSSHVDACERCGDFVSTLKHLNAAQAARVQGATSKSAAPGKLDALLSHLRVFGKKTVSKEEEAIRPAIARRV